MAKYFVNPFAIAGDRVIIPEPPQPSGSVSYAQGFPIDYELNQETDPQAKDVPRDQTNDLYYQITLALQQYQQNGFPDYITILDNLGVPYAYDYNNFVKYNDGSNGNRIYRSLTTSNIALPSDATKWQMLPFYINGTAGGSANVLTLNTSSTYQPFLNGDTVVLQASANNTGAATLQVGTDIARAINIFTASGLTPTPPSSIVSGGFYQFVFNSATWDLINPSSNTSVQYSQVQFDVNSSQILSGNTLNTPVLIRFDSVVTDSNGWWDPLLFRYTPSLAGKYRITGICQGSFASSDPKTLALYKNGSYFMRLSESDGGTVTPSGTMIVTANGTTDYFDLHFSSGSTVTIGSDGTTIGKGNLTTLFEIEYLGN